MSEINYATMVNSAMRNMIKDVLSRVAKEGLPGEHHFYITFLTDIFGIKIPSALKKQFPEEMTIVLQYEYENLVVNERNFSISLRFGGVPHTLIIPFNAIISFADPSCKFALHFEHIEEQTPEEFEEEFLSAPQQDNGGAEIISLDKYRKD